MSKKLKIGTVIILILLSAAAVSFLLYKYRNIQKTEFNNYLERLEETAGKGDKSSFNKLLREILVKKVSLSESGRLLRTVYNFSVMSNDYSFLERTADSSYSRYPEDEEITAVYVFALMKTGKSETAMEILKKTPLEGMYSTLLEEAELINGKTSAVGDYQNYKSLAKRTGYPGFLADAVLTALSQGYPEKAYELVNEIPEDYIDKNYLKFRSAFENGNYREAVNLLNKYDLGFDPKDFLLIKAELLTKTGRFNEAEDQLLRIIREYPDYSPIPYINLALIGSDNNDPELLKFLNKGIKFFSGDIDFEKSYVSFCIKSGLKETAIQFIENYCSDKPVFKLLSLSLRGAVEPGRIIAGIQEILLQYPDDGQIGSYYCMFLFKTGNIGLLKEYLDSVEEKRELNGWEKFYKGIVLAVSGEYSESTSLLEEAYRTEQSWEILYDLGLLYMEKKNYLKSIEMFQNCERDISDKERSMVRTSLAEVLYVSGNKKRAVKELRYALSLDSGNIKAVLLLNKLESE